MATIYQTNPGELIAQPDRQMATFASGLIRVDQTFVGVTSEATNHRTELAVNNPFPGNDTEPAIDGLFIFPTPQEMRTGDGFTNYKVSAYGRVNNTLNGIEMKQRQVSISNTLIGYGCYYWDLAGSIVKPSSEFLEFGALNISEEIYQPFGFYEQSGTYQFLSLTENYTAVIYTEGSGSRPSDGSGRSEVNIVRSAPVYVTYYTAIFSSDGVTEDVTITFRLTKPIVRIVAQRSFGYFNEYDIETYRDLNNDSTVIA